ncbi:STYKc [Musa troglodytarum]|uniref:non-specific serine/threonine protein kinase n=1 Tax=Musa troglodytarum TaxID=320322 RepID=A0A9E7IAC8_9LILI|nr:STYKc [Musa troglodytarum]
MHVVGDDECVCRGLGGCSFMGNFCGGSAKCANASSPSSSEECFLDMCSPCLLLFLLPACFQFACTAGVKRMFEALPPPACFFGHRYGIVKLILVQTTHPRLLSTGSRSPFSSFKSEAAASVILKSFGLNDLKTATKNFSSNSYLGEGGFGCVFKGWIDEHTYAPARLGVGMVVAIKKLKRESFQGHKEWLAEVTYLSQLRHDNLVKLIGYCSEPDNKLLVYEYMQKGSLENHLFKSMFALCHRLQDFNAKLSDFGLARNGPTGDKSHVSTRVVGTHGYAAPEYIATGHLSVKSDIYSLGVVLLELLSGRRAVDEDRGSTEEALVDWAKPFLNDKRKMLRIMDTRLEGRYLKKEAQTIAALALQCLRVDPKNRPNMTDILPVLEQLRAPKDMTAPRIHSKA